MNSLKGNTWTFLSALHQYSACVAPEISLFLPLKSDTSKPELIQYIMKLGLGLGWARMCFILTGFDSQNGSWPKSQLVSIVIHTASHSFTKTECGVEWLGPGNRRLFHFAFRTCWYLAKKPKTLLLLQKTTCEKIDCVWSLACVCSLLLGLGWMLQLFSGRNIPKI